MTIPEMKKGEWITVGVVFFILSSGMGICFYIAVELADFVFRLTGLRE